MRKEANMSNSRDSVGRLERIQIGCIEIMHVNLILFFFNLIAKFSVALHDPNAFKRLKVQPKKNWKSLSKTMRKSRGNTCRIIVKKHKNFLKAIVAHQR